MKNYFPFILGSFLLIQSCQKSSKTINQAERVADSLVAIMTLEEKVGQLTLYTSDYDVTGPHIRTQYMEDLKSGKVGAIFNALGSTYTCELQKIAVEQTRLGIPLLFGYDVIHGYKTIFPIPLGETATWDSTTWELSARIAAQEASAAGIHWTFSPMVDISRDPRWGRIMEGSGEDTYLTTLVSRAKVKGYQGLDLKDNQTLLACVKHYAAYGAAQAGRDYHTVDISDRVLREVYLPGYKAAIQAGAGSIMTSFNELDGVPASANRYLLTDILREEWNFQGFVVTDYTSIMEMLYHGNVSDTADAASASLKAGVDMDMQSGFFQEALPSLVEEGKLPIELIDKAVKRILIQKFNLGLFDDPYRYCKEKRDSIEFLTEDKRKAAREIASKSMVLLKNEGEILPLQKNRKLLIVGALAESKQDLIGSWSGQGEARHCTSILEGLQQVYSGEILFEKGCETVGDDRSGFSKAISAAQKSDLVLFVTGEPAWMSGEAASRTNINLPGIQEELFDLIAATGKPVVVVLLNGRPLAIPNLEQKAAAILEAWYPGTEGGGAVADILTGIKAPTGKLPVTFPRSLGQVPIFYNMKNTGRPYESDPNNKYVSKYLDESNYPLYPFGFGLTYTTFEITSLRVGKSEYRMGDKVEVTAIVRNLGLRDGEETLQLYIRDKVGSVTRPTKELKDFRKVNVKAGEETTVKFLLDSDDFSFYRSDMSWGMEPGEFSVMVGSNSRDIIETSFWIK